MAEACRTPTAPSFFFAARLPSAPRSFRAHLRLQE